MVSDSKVASDVIIDSRVVVVPGSAAESVESAMESATLDDAIEFSSPIMSAILCEGLFATAKLTWSIMLYIIVPAANISDNSPIVSSIEGAPPTTAITAAVTALDRLTPSVLIAADSVESAAVSDDTAAFREVATDATPETRDDTLVDSESDTGGSMRVSDDAACCREVATDSTLEFRDNTLVYNADESTESVAESDDDTRVSEFLIDVMPESR